MFIEQLIINPQDFDFKAGERGYSTRVLFRSEQHRVITSDTVVASAMVSLESGKKMYPHWHIEGEEVFYILNGRGKVFLDELERTVAPGSLIFVPLKTMHAVFNESEEVMKFVAFEIRKKESSVLPLAECVRDISDIKATEYYGAVAKRMSASFWPQRKEQLCQVTVESGSKMELHQHVDIEEFWYVLAGEGRVRLNDEEKTVYAGGKVYVPSGVEHGVAAGSKGALTIICIEMLCCGSLDSNMHGKLRLSR
jgi:mannose-6-phosphate isomerase-like protein (cupin superfamily)